MSLKHTIFRVARTIGASSLIGRSPWRTRRLLILCYHGVSFNDEHEWNPDLYVPPEHFRQRLETLRELNCSVLPMREALERLDDGTLPPRAVSITFDDGTTDFVRLAVPLLREFHMHATLYVTTYYSEQRYPVFDTALSYLLWKGRRPRGIPFDLRGEQVQLVTSTVEQRQLTWRNVKDRTDREGMNGASKNEVLKKIAEALEVSFEECFGEGKFHIMSPAELRALPRDLVELSLHTHRHRTPRERSLFSREVCENADKLRAVVGEAAGLADFCYPSGQYRGEFPDWLRDLGVVSATTCVPGLVSRRSPAMLLPRLLDTTHTDDEVFRAWALGFAELLPRRARNRLEPERLKRLAS